MAPPVEISGAAAVEEGAVVEEAAAAAVEEAAAAAAAAEEVAATAADKGGGGDVAVRGDRPISTVLIVIAMQTEALPLVNKFQLTEDTGQSLFPKGVPWVRYHGKYKDLYINLVWPGKDSVLGVDSVGTVSASLVTYASVQAFKPDLIINAGTAGGFKAKGACVGDVYIASDVAFHDRRIPIPVFDLYGIGARPTFSTPNLLKELNLKLGKLSTGDSLDMSHKMRQRFRQMMLLLRTWREQQWPTSPTYSQSPQSSSKP
uniref:Nucleoside phosphorylase domain-containing protein n=1 Tax=Ananas comosus var. bracteatus TaxID=296719 RepID=A0A6V7PJM9_ANACO|nr:unnamed protein product [Ananas comosus var. bracteatus]